MKEPAKFDGPQPLIQGLLERGIFVFETGNPGATKTLVTLDLMARLTRGKAPGDLKGKPVIVIYVSIEGGFMRSIGPRFKAAGGNFAKFWHYEEVIFLPSDIDRLEKLIRKHRAALIVIDPIKDHFDHGVYSSPTKTTQCLRQLHSLAERTNCTILGVDWPSKARKKGDLSVSGNQAFTGVPRLTIAVGRLNRDEWVIGVSKGNDIAPLTGYVYGLDAKEVGKSRTTGKKIVTRKIVWKRVAIPAEVQRAHEQADIEEDPNLKELLQFMDTADAIPTKDIVNWLKNTRMVGKNKAYALLNAAREAGYIEDIPEGQGGDYKVTWKITDIGQLKLAPSEEEEEAAIEILFPSMDPKPLPRRLALPKGDN